jgi:hypothetical protein
MATARSPTRGVFWKAEEVPHPMTDIDGLKVEFDRDMRQILEKEGEAGLNSTRFRQMIEQYGGIETARRLLKPDRELPANMFGYLRDIGRPDLTIEHYVCLEKYRSLFSKDEREIAEFRLRAGD